ncbi:DUF6941 family protein [Ralstonia solanacearum]|uniref:DUF6941 family protein n=1 Tax=Ralstonia solanacearum TaxID=305 RepID=UPI001E4EF680|nr:hypothetical protein [Ralstonia solanacearum]
MKVANSFFADTIIRDAERNTLTIVDLIEEFDVPSFPAVMPRLSLCFIIVREDGDEATANLELKFISPHGSQSFEIQANFEDKMRTRVITRFEGYVIFQPGVIRAELHKGTNLLGVCETKAVGTTTPNVPNIVQSS